MDLPPERVADLIAAFGRVLPRPRVRSRRIHEGPDEVHESFVARRVLKEYGVEVEV